VLSFSESVRTEEKWRVGGNILENEISVIFQGPNTESPEGHRKQDFILSATASHWKVLEPEPHI
jgi:hypothetical protein